MLGPKIALHVNILVIILALSSAHAAEPSEAPRSGKLLDVADRMPQATPEGEPHGVKSAALKGALRKLAAMLRSEKLHRVLEWLESEANERVVKVARNHAHQIADAIDELIQWEALTLRAVQAQLAGALQAAGVAPSTATEAAFWLKNFIEWTLL